MQGFLRFAGELEGLQLGGDGEGEEAEQDPAQQRRCRPISGPACASVRRARRPAGSPSALVARPAPPRPFARSRRLETIGLRSREKRPLRDLIDLVFGRPSGGRCAVVGHERARNHGRCIRSPPSAHCLDERRPRRSGSISAARRCSSGSSTATPRSLCESREASTGQTEERAGRAAGRARSSEAREARPDVAAVGLGIPATIDHDRGVAVSAVNLPIDDLPLRDLVGERTGLPVFVDNDANVAALAEHLYGAARGADNVVMLTIGTGIGGGLILGGEIYRGSTGAGAELGHIVIEIDGPPCQGNCPTTAASRRSPRGRRSAARAARRPNASPTRRSAGCSPRARRSTARRSPRPRMPATRAAIGVFDLIGSRLGVALRQLRQHLRAGRDRDRRRRDRAPATCCSSRPAREVRRRALPPMNGTPVVAAELGDDAGMIGAAAMARIELERRRRADAGRADRLPDPDRQPRRRHRCGCARRWSPPTTSPARTPAAPAACSTSSGSARRRR